MNCVVVISLNCISLSNTFSLYICKVHGTLIFRQHELVVKKAGPGTILLRLQLYFCPCCDIVQKSEYQFSHFVRRNNYIIISLLYEDLHTVKI